MAMAPSTSLFHSVSVRQNFDPLEGRAALQTLPPRANLEAQAACQDDLQGVRTLWLPWSVSIAQRNARRRPVELMKRR